MNYLSIAGLALDLAGVLMLGVDLVRVQRRLRQDAADRLNALEDISKSAGGLDAFLKSISGDWREFQRDEGRYVPQSGTFDYDSAKQSFDEMKDGINGLADNLLAIASMMVASVKSDQQTANISLRVSYVGLGLIVVGFCLQIPAYL